MKKTLLFAAAFALVLALPAAADDASTGCLAQELGLAEMSLETVETVEAVGTPEPIAMACSEEWYNYRWVYGGCCYGSTITRKDKQQRQHCCFTTSGTYCGGWYDTGATQCTSSYCPS